MLKKQKRLCETNEAFCRRESLLPRMPNEAMIPLKLKRKLRYKRHYLYDYVRPDKVMTALKWLKCNNPLYSSIDINDEWINNESIVNSDYIESDNVDNGCDDVNERMLCDNVQSTDRITILRKNAKARGFTIHDVPGDNDCFLHAVSYQLPNIGIQCINAKIMRTMG